MKPIEYLLPIFFVCILLLIRNYKNLKIKVLTRFSLVCFIAAFFMFSINPGLMTGIAKKLGVGRGADLLAYATTLGLIFLAGLFMTKNGQAERRLSSLVRNLAIDDYRKRRRK